MEEQSMAEPFRHRNSCWTVIDPDGHHPCDCLLFALSVRQMAAKMLPELERILAEKRAAETEGKQS
jgi:hypothetical protein